MGVTSVFTTINTDNNTITLTTTTIQSYYNGVKYDVSGSGNIDIDAKDMTINYTVAAQ